MILSLSLLMGAAPWSPPTDVPVCGSEGEAATWLAYRTPVHTPPPPGAKQLPQDWSISRQGDLIVMRDMTGNQMKGGFDASAMYDAIGTLYEWLPDDYDFVTFLTNTDASRAMNALAFYAPLGNDTEGIGMATYRSGSHIQGMLFMNAWQYWTGGSDTLTSAVFGQELGHRWSAFVGYDLGDGAVHYDTLGRDDSHWSYWLETSNSPVEGNAWEDNGDGSFTLDAGDEIAFSDLDLYLMGLIGPEEVDPFFVIQDPTGLSRDAASSPEYYASGRDQTAYGTRQDITIEDVIRAEGERSPAVGESPTDFNMLVVIVLAQDEAPTESLLEGVESVRERFVNVWEEDTQYLATLDGTPGEAQLAPFDPTTLTSAALVPKSAW